MSVMFICNCNAIRESELRDAAGLCDGGVESVYATLGKKPNCGSCLSDAEDIVFDERELLATPVAA